MRHRTRVACALASFGVGLPARADDPSLTASLDVDVAEAVPCLDTARLQAAVERRLERRVFVSPRQADVVLSIRLARAENRAVVIELRHGAETVGSRTLEVDDTACDRFGEALVLVAGMLLDVPRDEVVASEPPAPAAPAPARGSPADRSRRPATVARPSSPSWSAEVIGLVTASRGMLPRFGFGAEVAAIVTPPGFWGVRAALGAEQGSRVLYRDGAITSRAVTARLGVVPLEVALAPRTEIAFWASSFASGLLVDASGFDRDRDGSRWLLGAALGGGARWNVGRFELVSEAEVAVPFTRPELTVGEADGSSTTLHAVSPIVAHLAVGIGWKP